MKWVLNFWLINNNSLLIVLLNLQVYLSLSSSHACRCGISCLVGEPQPRIHMLNITNGVSVLDLRGPHAISISLCSSVKLLLKASQMLIYMMIWNVLLRVLRPQKLNFVETFTLWTDHILKKVVNFSTLLTFDDLKQKDVVLMSALSLSTRCRPFSSVRPRYLPVVTWQSRKACPQPVCRPLHLRNTKHCVFFICL